VLRHVERALARGDGATDPTLGREQQLAYRALAAHPAWVDRVVAEVPAGVRDAVRANVAAGAALGGLTGEAPAGFPAWEILVPEPSTTLRRYYDEAERASGVPWQYLAAIHLVETRVGRIRGLSSAGAQGPMQFIPATWEAHGEGDINDDRDAILAAGRYLASRGAPSDMDRALFSYNNDDRYVAAVKAYADVLAVAPAAYDGYHQWQVFYATVDGTFLLPEGWHG
jgi:soluble lytic murein transglycosylase-like protein